MATGTAPEHQALRRDARSWRVLAIVLGFLACGAVVGASTLAATQDAATPVTADQVGAAGCPAELHGEGAEAWVRAELYFGSARPDGPAVTEAEWRGFLDTEITPRFPDGLTVLTGLGQWRNEQGTIIQERSQVLIILYPSETAAESSALLEEIRELYEQEFQQSSVLRANVTEVCTSF